MQHKIDQLKTAIREKAQELGLVFVNGPDTEPTQLEQPEVDFGQTNGQQRAVVSFALTEQ